MKNHPNIARLSASRLHHNHTVTRNLVGISAVLADFTAIAIAIFFSWHLYSGLVLSDAFEFWFFLRHFLILGTLFVGITILKWSYRFSSLINKDRPFKDVLIAWSLAYIAFVSFIFVMKVSAEFSRGSVILTFPVGLIFLILTRYAFAKRIVMLTKTGLISPERMLLVGRTSEVTRFAKQFQPWNFGYMIVDTAILPEKLGNESDDLYALRIKPRLDEIVLSARDMAFNTVFLALPWSEKAAIEIATEELLALPAALHLAPDSILERFSEPVVQRVGSITTLALARPPLSPLEIFAKRGFDLTAGLLIFICALPFMALIALLIKLESKGPVFFMQWRNGFNQNPFKIVKFRSMSVTEEGANVKAAEKNDPRVTKIGAFIRRWNLDEVPQIFNVIRGDMSLVGPRPHPLNLDEVEQKRVSLYARRFNIKPGMTGWAQVNGARGSVSDENSMSRRVNYDIWYMDHWSLGLDIMIMIKTVTSKKAFENAF